MATTCGGSIPITIPIATPYADGLPDGSARLLRRQLHCHRDAGLRARADEVVERELVYLVACDFGEARLYHAKAFGRLRLGKALARHPSPQGLGKLAAQEHDRRLVWGEAQIEKHVPAALSPFPLEHAAEEFAVGSVEGDELFETLGVDRGVRWVGAEDPITRDGGADLVEADPAES